MAIYSADKNIQPTNWNNKIKLVSHGGDISSALHGLGWNWVLEDECSNYLPGEAVVLPQAQADDLLRAADELYEMMVGAVPDDLPDDFLRQLAIPENLWGLVRHSWNDDRHWHLYGRFDLAQTAEGPKLIEFNADTATGIPETAVVQWASLAAAGKNDASQVSGLYEALVAQFQRWLEKNNDLEPALLITYIGASAEDYTNCEVLAQAAQEAGFNTHLCAIEEVTFTAFGEDRGIWAQTSTDEWQRFSFVYKLLPWEQLAWEEPELIKDLDILLRTRNVVIANPAYTLILQSKGMLAWLWQNFPYHPLLLETSFGRLGGHYVTKPFYGREGQNVEVIQSGESVIRTEGEFADQPKIYQRYCNFPKDEAGNLYQTGVFWAGEGCAIGYRRAPGIINNTSQFLAHLLEE
ncbi:glutathionylspermidine synthase [Adhaeribacter aerolatus]|uniref:Glutathionylspermidine synthase n=1 Tax=Adhaeribacter aerolatus TaxID=670289 RepID=A0A512B5M1_9BACT|nr:glutathionylspermidine synthase family protein [Adhaeribacter aerolatus]GEO07268.1 glutathionylspermidine synthase [Adhaeribacter aerolatus]